MKLKLSRQHYLGFLSVFVLGILAVVVAIVLVGSSVSTASTQANTLLIQDEPEVNLLAGSLDRLSWGAVIAGSLITLILMFLLNLIGIAIGLAQVNPAHHDTPDAGTFTMGSIIWVAISNLIALFVGGWIAAYFAGIPEPGDGLLHGIMVWAVSGIITVILVMSGVGRLMSGVAGLINTSLNLTGSLAAGAGQVAGGAIHSAGSAVGAVGNLSSQALSALAGGVQSSAQLVSSGMADLSETAIENSPDVQNALSYQDLSFEGIRLEAKRLLADVGQDPDKVEQKLDATGHDLQTAAKHLMRHPEHAEQLLDVVLRRAFRRAEDVANDVDREALVNLLTQRTDMSQEDAEQQIQRWEQQFNEVKQQTSRARDVARQKAEEFRQQAEARAQEIYQQAQDRAAELQREAEARLQEVAHEAEERAREAAQAASDTFAKVAAGIAISMVIGAAAAGFGGFIGAPEDLPDVTVEEASVSPTNAVTVLINTVS